MVNRKTFKETSLKGEGGNGYIRRLHVNGLTRSSTAAIANLKEICEEYLKGRYKLEIIDIYKNPHLAEGEQIIAAPTLIKQLPVPLRRVIGDMSNTSKVLLGLDILPDKENDHDKIKKNST